MVAKLMIILLISYTLGGCSTPSVKLIKESRWNIDPSKAECYPENEMQIQIYHSHHQKELLRSSIAEFSYDSRHFAETMGLVPTLSKMALLKKKGKTNGFEWLNLRQTVLERALITQNAIAKTIANFDCDKERTEILADYLAQSENDRTKELALLAIIAGAVGATATGGLSLAGYETASNTVAIISGLIGGAIGLTALSGEQEHHLDHPKNPIREAWLNPKESEFFPVPVWKFLNDPASPNHPISRRENLLEEWKVSGWLGDSPEDYQHRTQLFIGNGGKYTLDELRTRAQILDVLKDEVSLAYRKVGIFLKDFSEFCALNATDSL